MVAKVKAVLDSGGGERAVARFLRKNPELVLWPFHHGSHSNYVLHEFPIGIKHKADFVVLSSYSGAWEVAFVEIEPVADGIITKAGTPTKRLAGAISQLGDWSDFVERNRASIQRDLSDWCVRKDLLKWSKRNPPSNMTSNHLKDPETTVFFHYAVVLGRRASITTEGWRKINQHRAHWHHRIRTYDLFVDIAANMDARAAQKSVNMCDTEEHWYSSITMPSPGQEDSRA
jgi:hypothetical protein